MKYELRSVNPSKDLESVNQIMEDSWKEAYDDILTDSELENIDAIPYTNLKELKVYERDPHIKAEIAWFEGNPAGFFVACNEEYACDQNPTPELSLAYVSPDYQRNDIGSITIGIIEDEISDEWNRDVVRVEAFSENKEAIKFYQSNGYKIKGVHWHDSAHEQWIEEDRNFTVMEKLLS